MLPLVFISAGGMQRQQQQQQQQQFVLNIPLFECQYFQSSAVLHQPHELTASNPLTWQHDS
jgi:hypothetical protein